MDILVYALAAVSVFSIYYLAKLRVDLENLRKALVLVVKVLDER